MQVLGQKAAIFLGVCAAITPAIGQKPFAKLPADCAAYASVPLPPEAATVIVPKSPPACASYRSYRGIGRPASYSEARACAWKDRLAQKAGLGQNPREGTAWVVGGSLILADIYFNGAGVKRDIPLALRFACESEQGMAQLAMPDVAKLNGSQRSNVPFEFCDYATTTFTMNFCSGYGSQMEDDRRNRYNRSIEARMTPEQRAAFQKLLVVENAYMDAHALEVYQGGTMRTLRTIGSESILRDLFHAEVVRFERKEWPDLSHAQISSADMFLHREYERKLQEMRALTKDELEDGAVTASNLSHVQASWEAYRDAWVAFASLRYPSNVDNIRAKITLDRYRLLKTM